MLPRLPHALVLLVTLPLLGLLACGEPSTPARGAIAVAPSASEPHDPDLKLGKTCSGHPTDEQLLELLPTYVKELVVMWPRVGRTERDGSCASVARLTLVNHQGILLTLSLMLHESPSEPSDYQVVPDGPMPYAVLQLQPDPSRPKIGLELAGAASTSRDTLEQTLEFVRVDELVEQLGQLAEQ